MNHKENRAIALTTSDYKEQKRLALSPDMCTRRNLGFNKSLSKEVAELLLGDPVMNVNYIINKYQYNSSRRTYPDEQDLSTCVFCDETTYENCSGCFLKKN